MIQTLDGDAGGMEEWEAAEVTRKTGKKVPGVVSGQKEDKAVVV